jgi:hypothetical protein
MEELKRIHPEVVYTLETGEQVTVSPIGFRKLGRFGQAVISIFGKLREAGVDVSKLELTDQSTIALALSLAFDEVVDLMAVILGKDMDWFEKLSPVDGALILEIMIKQNWNENTKKKLTDLLGRIQSVST